MVMGTAGRAQPGTAGSGGTVAVPPDMPAVAFWATVGERGAVALNSMRGQPIYYRTCSNALVLEKADGGVWAALQDDRPPSYNNPGYYLDGQFIHPAHNLGCDFVACRQLSDGEPVGAAIEYFRSGTAAPPAEPNLAPDPVVTVESRGLHGKMRVRFSYFVDPSCTKGQSIDVPFDVPEGICCLLGAGDCGGSARVGGWAPTEATCRDDRTDADAYYAPRLDPWGCPELVQDDATCCNCVDDDAGVEF